MLLILNIQGIFTINITKKSRKVINVHLLIKTLLEK